MARGYWLVKQEPTKYSFAQLVQDGRTMWDGVRNHQARNNLAAMRVGDRVLFYHSVIGTEVVGICEVVRDAYPDPTAVVPEAVTPEASKAPRWVVVDLAPVQALRTPVSLQRIKEEPALRDIPLLRQSRLSVMPLEKAAFDRIVALGR